jgi:hypothetical protein
VLSQHVGDDGKVVSDKITVGIGGLFRNLDAVVMGAVSEKIGVQYQDDTELVVICGRQLLADKYFPLVNQSQPNTEALAADLIISQKRIGGLQAVRAPYFPANALLITRLDTDENVLVLSRTYANRSNAERAAKMQWERLQRGVATFSIQLVKGRAELYTEMPVKVSGFKQPIDAGEWIITTLTHSLSSENGYTTNIELEVKIASLEMG